jgi:hypothetical protein
MKKTKMMAGALIPVILAGIVILSFTGCIHDEGGKKPSLVKIEVTTEPKTTYDLGEALDVTGMVVTGTYSNGSTKDVTAEAELSPLESGAAGTKTITVTVGEKITTFTVTVVDPSAAAAAFGTAHSAILGKTVDTVAIADEAAVDAALAAYNALGAGAKALLGTEKSLLDGLKAKIGALKAATAAPTADAVSVAKTGATQASVAFTLTNTPAYADDTTWKVYAANTGTTEAVGVTASNSGATLTLAHATNIPAATYYVTAAETGKPESTARLALTVAAYVAPGQSATPAFSGTGVAKTGAAQASVTFTLTNTPAYADDTTWKVYVANTGTTEAAGVSVANSGATLTLTHATDIPAAAYYVAATESGKTESNRLALTVTVYVPPVTAAPTVDAASVAKTGAAQASVTFTLTNSPAYADDTTWKVYAANTGTTEAAGVTASNSGATLTLTHATDIPAAAYYVAATEPGKTEGSRLALTVTAYVPPVTVTPTADVTGVARTSATQASVAFTLTNNPAFAAATWTVYSVAVGGTALTGVTASNSGATLTLTHATDLPEGTYHVSVTETGKTESAARLALTVTAYIDPTISVNPTASPAGVAKAAEPQASVAFTLTNNPAYANTTIWKVYAANTGSGLAAGVTASNSGATLTLTHATDLPTATYYVTATETGKTESTARLALTVTYVGSIGSSILWVGDAPPITGASILLRSYLADTQVLNAAAGYTDCTWTLNGYPLVADVPGGAAYTFRSAGKSPALYRVGLRAKRTADSLWYSEEISFTVIGPLDLSGLGANPGAAAIQGAISAGLSTFTGDGSTVDDPKIIALAGLNLSGTGTFAALFNGVADAFTGGEYISLDLSWCASDTNTITGLDSATLANATRDRFAAITLPAAVTTLARGSGTAYGPFAYFGSLKCISAPGVTTIGNYAFLQSALTEVNIPAATSIGQGAFRMCAALTEVKFLAATSIGEDAFSDTALTTVGLPLATSIGAYAFEHCHDLVTISLPAAASIGGAAFRGDAALETVRLPVVTSLGSSIFDGCTALTEVRLGLNVPNPIGTNIFVSTGGSSRTITVYFRGAISDSVWNTLGSTNWGSSGRATIVKGATYTL